jgi:hypothetical protein
MLDGDCQLARAVAHALIRWWTCLLSLQEDGGSVEHVQHEEVEQLNGFSGREQLQGRAALASRAAFATLQAAESAAAHAAAACKAASAAAASASCASHAAGQAAVAAEQQLEEDLQRAMKRLQAAQQQTRDAEATAVMEAAATGAKQDDAEQQVGSMTRCIWPNHL